MNFAEILRSIVFDHPEYLSESAWHSHIPFAFWCVNVVRPRIFVELGTHNGDSYCAFCQAVDKFDLTTACYAIDTWKGDEHAGLYGEEVYETLQRYHNKRYGAFSRLVRSTFDEAVEYFSDSSIDLLHIDGLHTYESVKHDFETWVPKLSTSAVVLLHDINVRERDFGVWRLWEELSELHPHFSFLHGNGLGLLAVGQEPQPIIKHLCSLSYDETQEIRSIFARLGRTVSVMSERDWLAGHAARLESILAEHESQFSQLAGELTAANQEVSDRHNSWAQLQQELAQREGRVEMLQQELAQREGRVEMLQQELAQREGRVEMLQQELAQREGRVEVLQQELAQREGRVEMLQQELAQREGRVEVLQQELAQREGRVEMLQQEPAQREGRVEMLQQELAQREGRVEMLQQELAQREGRVEVLQQELAQREGRVEVLQQELAQREGRVEMLQQELAQREGRVEMLQQELAQREGRVEMLQQELAQREGQLSQLAGELAAVYSSRSWRLTKPLRGVVGRGRRAKGLLRCPWRLPTLLLPAPIRNRLRHRGHAYLIRRSGLFDPAFYIQYNPDVATARMDPVIHYLLFGATEGRDPNPGFNTTYYLGANADVAQAGINPLVHYLQQGAQEGRNPNPLFDAAWYLAHNPDVAQAGINPLVHYLQQGAQEGRNPNPLFDAAWYLAHNPDVAQAGINPLVHYLQQGAQEGRNPNPLFDAAWYLAHNPDVAQAGINPLVHYLRQGAQEGRNPNPLFDAAWYLAHNPDVAQAGINPLVHYLQQGAQEGRNPNPLFDAAWYLAHNPDVAQAGINPLVHYLQQGAQEGRNPNPTFSARDYLTANLDVARAGVNPLLHYLHFGQRENRQLIPPVPLPSSLIRADGTKNAQCRVLFISGEPDTPGHLYRVERYARALNAAGFDASWVRIDELSGMLDHVCQANALVIWRAVWSDVVAQAIAAARQVGAVIIFDVDDYMIDPVLAHVEIIDGIRSQGLREDAVKDFYSRMQCTMLAADYCTCPTMPLAKALRLFGKPTFILPNGFDEHTYTASRRARFTRNNEPADGLIRLGYAAGSRTHQKDFAQAASGIVQILREHAECRLVLFRREFQDVSVATLDPHEFPELRGLEKQIEWRTFVPLEQLPQEIARFDINLVPLEVGNVYCEAKSELKFFEAALASVPTVASPTAPLRAAIRHGITGFLAISQEEWYSSLKQLVARPDLRGHIARQAMYDVLWTFGPERRSELVASAFEQMLHGGRTAARLFQLEVMRSRSERPVLPVVPEFDVVFQSCRRDLSAVSVVVPLYNYAHYIEEALESVKAQTLRERDLIVVEDRSTDNSLAVARRWLEQNQASFNHVALLQNRTNSGLGLTRNVGFAFSEARFILPLDADNKLLPECLHRCLKDIEHSGAAVAYPIIQDFGDGNDLRGQWEWTPSRFIFGNYIDAMALIRKAAWAAVGGYDHVRFGWEDYDLWCKFVEHGLWGIRVAETLALYRCHTMSMLRTQTEVIENKRQLLENMRHRHPWLNIYDARLLEEPVQVSHKPSVPVRGRIAKRVEADV